MHGLYAIVDVETLEQRGLELVPFTEAILRARPAALQLRDKSSGARAMLERLERLLPLCRAANVALFANDRADLAALAGADGVHLGQHDLPVSIAREMGAKMGVSLQLGVSAHDDAELDWALAMQPDYVALGPVFDTTSKELKQPTLGIEGLARLAARARPSGLPLVAIGGLDVARLRLVRPITRTAAVIGALIPESRSYVDVTERAMRLNAALLEP
ncbi:MAG: thiamine phosphate synthase [Myxococcales bacterium]|nr:thiamine phosphate synthase [Myxococcales bacterium]